MYYLNKLKENGHTVTWAAKQLDIDRGSLSRYLHGHRNMPVEVEAKLRKVLYLKDLEVH